MTECSLIYVPDKACLCNSSEASFWPISYQALCSPMGTSDISRIRSALSILSPCSRYPPYRIFRLNLPYPTAALGQIILIQFCQSSHDYRSRLFLELTEISHSLCPLIRYYFPRWIPRNRPTEPDILSSLSSIWNVGLRLYLLFTFQLLPIVSIPWIPIR